eukprot:snap_masked-scaffold_19-processed-gene-3.32-mRNA-1 protein AED:1.00 eAED:1.00 QI:0/0/0/0/1/1/2/0/99
MLVMIPVHLDYLISRFFDCTFMETEKTTDVIKRLKILTLGNATSPGSCSKSLSGEDFTILCRSVHIAMFETVLPHSDLVPITKDLSRNLCNNNERNLIL